MASFEQQLTGGTLFSGIEGAGVVSPRDFPKVDVLHASPPCQPYSMGRDPADSPRRRIAGVIPDWIRHVRPSGFSLEQVTKFRNSSYCRQILAVLEDCGYSIFHGVVDAYDYGLPQHRRRYLLLASRHGWIERPTPSLFRSGWVCATRDLWAELPEASPLKTQETAYGPLSEWWSISSYPFLIQRIGAPRPSTGSPYICLYDAASRTVKAMGGDRHWRQMNLYRDGRLFSPGLRFYARLQSFPDWFNFKPFDQCRRDRAAKGIGNAYPPDLAEMMFRILQRAIVGAAA